MELGTNFISISPPQVTLLFLILWLFFYSGASLKFVVLLPWSAECWDYINLKMFANF